MCRREWPAFDLVEDFAQRLVGVLIAAYCMAMLEALARVSYGAAASAVERAYQSAASSVSPVRMRMTRSMSVMKILPSPTLPVFGGLEDGFDHLIHQVAAHSDFDRGLGHEVHDIFGAAIELGVAALAAEAFDFGNRHARDADVGQRRAHVVELEGLDDGGDQFR